MLAIYTSNAAFRTNPLELLCTAYPGNAVLPEMRRPRSVQISELEFHEKPDDEDELRLEFTDGNAFRMYGTQLIRRFFDDCIGMNCEKEPDVHATEGIITLQGNRFWAYTGIDGITAICSRKLAKKEYTLKEVALEDVLHGA